jgi:hypothetical protein
LPGEPHKRRCSQNTRRKLGTMKSTIGKRTSEGYKPEVNEKVEVRGD